MTSRPTGRSPDGGTRRAAGDDVLAANGIVALYDDADDQEVPDLNDRGEWLFVADNAVVAASARHSDHYATVALEVWSGEPPAETGPWEATGERALGLDSGDLERAPARTRGTKWAPVIARQRARVDSTSAS